MRTMLRLVACAVGTLLLGAPVARAEGVKLRASLDTSATHLRTVTVGEYLQKLQEASGGKIETELFHSAQLFRDRDVAKALRQGGIEMAVPGTWVVTGFVADADIFQIPAFYGQSADAVHKISDGPVGKKINEQLEKKLGVKIVGPWLDLGYQNTYSTAKPLNDVTDLQGMKIRNSGGAGQFLRAKFFGATPNMTAWPDVPLALSQGTFDALSSTNESLVSAKLWEAGVRYAISTREFYGFYVPMVSETFMKKLSPDLQKLVVDVWAKNIPAWRERMAKAQDEARETLASHGVKFVEPGPEKLATVRQQFLSAQDSIVAELKITPELAKEATATLSATH